MKIKIPEKNKVFFIIPSIAYDYRDGVSGIWCCWLTFGFYVDFTE